jgi:hypothetical protein
MPDVKEAAMLRTAIDTVDAAAVVLLQSLATNGEALQAVLDRDGQTTLMQVRDDVIALRRALLGLQMGALYWSAQTEDDDDATGTA